MSLSVPMTLLWKLMCACLLYFYDLRKKIDVEEVTIDPMAKWTYEKAQVSNPKGY